MTNSPFIYKFSRQFTKFPGGRYRRHGPSSGEEFREDILKPLLAKHDLILLDLTGAKGFGSSFLDESFGEMGVYLGWAECERRLTFVCDDDPDLVDMIWAKIEKASKA